MSSSSNGGNADGSGVSNREDLEQRLGGRMDTALTRRMEAMMGQLSNQLSSLLQGVSNGRGEHRKSNGWGRAAAGGN